MLKLCLALLFILFLNPPLQALLSLSAKEMSVDGLKMKNLSCQLEQGGMFALLSIMGSLSKFKKELDACAPEGAALKLEWKFSANKIQAVKVIQGSAQNQNTCVEKALLFRPFAESGACSGILLMGNALAAEKAAQSL